MARSDRHDAASDSLVREVARQLAEAAPPAPEWEDLHWRRTYSASSTRPPAWPRMALVAATTALVVSGLWWVARPSPELNEPADLPEPAPTTSVAAPAEDPVAAWQRWVAGTDPIDVQLCLSRVSSNLTASSELPSPSARPGLPGDTPAGRELIWHRPSQTVLATIVTHPDIKTTVADQAASVVSAYQTAEDNQFDEEGQVSEDLEPTIEVFLDERDTSRALRPDPDTCWLETTDGQELIAATSQTLDATESLRCHAAAQRDHALLIAADRPDDFGSIADVNARVIPLWWFQGPPDDLVAITSEVQDAVLLAGGDTGARLHAARAALAVLALPEVADGCPLTAVTAPNPTDTPTSDSPPTQEE
jgi:hypothetical protein